MALVRNQLLDLDVADWWLDMVARTVVLFGARVSEIGRPNPNSRSYVCYPEGRSRKCTKGRPAKVMPLNQKGGIM